MPNADVYFKTEYKIGTGQKLVLSGDSPELGCWHEDYSIEAMLVEPWDDGVHLVIIKLPMNKPIKWKWAIADDDSKIQIWEDCPDRHLCIDRKLLLIHAPWNEEEKIMDESVRHYDFVPSFVLFDIAWQKKIPTRRMYQPNNNRQNKSSSAERSAILTKDMQATRERMIELQKKWSDSDRSQSREEFLKKGFNEFVKNKGRQSPAGVSSKRVTFQEKPSIVGESNGLAVSTSPPDSCPDCRNVVPTQRLERPKSAKSVHQQTSDSPEPRLRPDVETRVCEYLEHIEGERKRRATLSDEERTKEDEEMEKDEKEVQEATIIDLCPIPRPRERGSPTSLMLVTGAAGCVLLVFLGYYVYKKL